MYLASPKDYGQEDMMTKKQDNNRLDKLSTRKGSLEGSEKNMLAYYTVGYHGSVYICDWLGGHSTSETLGWFKDGWYRACIPVFFRQGLFRKLQEQNWFKASLEVDGYSFEDMSKRAPDFLEELKKWVNTGRLELSDGTYSQPYSFIISGESNIRQFQYGTKATKEAIGVDIKYHMQQEAGFHPQLPQIFKGMGYKGVLLRVHWGHWGWCPPIRQHRIFWEGLDGSRVDTVPSHDVENPSPATFRNNWAIMFGVDVPRASLSPWDPNLQKKIKELNGKYTFLTDAPDMFRQLWTWQYAKRTIGDLYLADLYNNIGLNEREALDIATRLLDQRIRECGSKTEERIFSEKKLRFSTLEEYFESTPGPEETVFIPNEDFEYKHVNGMYGDILTIKNKEAENKLYEAEVLSALCCALGGPDSSQDLFKAWKLTLGAQNHDVYCIPNAFMWAIAQCSMRRGLDENKESINIVDGVLNKSLRQICARIDTRPLKSKENCIPVVIFNTLSWTRTEPVEAEVFFPPGVAKSVTVFNGEKEIVSQITEQEKNQDGSFSRVKIIFIARDVPSVGYKVYHLVYEQEEIKKEYRTDLQVNRTTIENKKLKVKFTPSGYIESVVDKVSGEEFLDTSAYYGNEFTAVFPDLGFRKSSEFDTKMEMVEKGPVRATVKVTGKFGGYDYTLFTHIYSRVDRIDFDTVFDFGCQSRIGNQNHSVSWLSPPDGAWNSRDKLRVVFNPKIENGQLFADMPFAVYLWKKDTILGYNWADYSNSKKGLTLINTGNIGYYRDPAKDVELSLILAYGGPFRNKGPTYLFGVNRFQYSLFPHPGDWKKAKSYQCAFEANNPLLAVPAMVHSGELEQVKSFMQIEPANVVLSALVAGEELTMRLFEIEGRESATAIKLGVPIKKANEVNLLGEKLRELKFTNNTIREVLMPHKILTLKLEVR